jgi:hypothetical protein
LVVGGGCSVLDADTGIEIKNYFAYCTALTNPSADAPEEILCIPFSTRISPAVHVYCGGRTVCVPLFLPEMETSRLFAVKLLGKESFPDDG